MKKTYATLPLCFLIGLVIMTGSAWLVAIIYQGFENCADVSWPVHMILPVSLMIGAIISHKAAKGRTFGYLLSYFLNALGSGCTIGALAGVKAIVMSCEVLLALLPIAGFAVVMYLLFRIPGSKWHSVVIGIFPMLSLAYLGFGIYVWIRHSSLYGSAMVFGSLFFLPFPIGCSTAQEKPERKFRHLSFTGFGAFFVVALVAAAIMSSGEILEGLDFGGGTGKSKNKTPK